MAKFDPNIYDYNYNSANSDSDWSASFWNENQQRVVTPQNSENNLFSFNSPWFTNTVIFSVVVVAALVILILVITVVAVSEMTKIFLIFLLVY